MQEPLPTFLGIGAQKAGTSWLFKQFQQHPDIWMPPVKELHFFDRARHYPSPNNLATTSPLSRWLGSEPWERPRMMAGLRGTAKRMMQGNFREATWWSKWSFGYYTEDWYRSLFLPGRSRKICGEITPAYSILDSPDVARIKAIDSEVKLIFAIRNPIERAWSAIRFQVAKGQSAIDLDSDDAVISELQKPQVVLRTDYERTLEVYLEHFDSSQILVCFFDAIQKDPLGLMSDIAAFLGIAPFTNGSIDFERRVNASPTKAMSPAVRDYLLDTYAPMTDRLAEALGSYVRLWNSTDNLVGGSYQQTDLPPTVYP